MNRSSRRNNLHYVTDVITSQRRCRPQSRLLINDHLLISLRGNQSYRYRSYYSSIWSHNYGRHNYPPHRNGNLPSCAFGNEATWLLPHLTTRSTTGLRNKWSISLDDIMKINKPAASTAAPSSYDSVDVSSLVESTSPDDTTGDGTKHKVLDVSTYHGWDSIDAQDTSTDDTDVIVKKEVAEWDPVRKMVVKKIVTTLVTRKPSTASFLPELSYDGQNMKLKTLKAEKKARVKAAQKDPTSKLCKKCPICLKHFTGHKSMIHHLLYRDKCYNELSPEMQTFLVKQKIQYQQKRLRHKLRKKHLPTLSPEEIMIKSKTEEEATNAEPFRDLRYKLKKTQPESERAIAYK